MQQAEIEQIKNIIINFEEQKNFIPYFSDLVEHETFGLFFKNISPEQKQEIEEIIKNYIVEKIQHLTKTKGGQLFKRFFEAYPDLFWEFRKLNDNSLTHTPEFQKVGKQVESEIFKLEGILTEKMLNQEKGLDKVVSSFYNIVYTFFPKYSLIE